MNVQTEPGDDNLSSVFTVATIQRKMFSRSSLSTFIVNKNLDNIDDNITSYNRIVGLDFNLASADNLWIGKAFYHHSFYKNAGNKPFATTGSLKYNNGVLSADIDYSFVGSGYEAEVGFVKRNGYHQFRPKIEYKFYPNKGSVQNHGPSIKLDTFVDEDFDLTDQEIEIKYIINWRNRSKFTFDLENGYVKLKSPFDPTNIGGDTLSTGTEYNWNEFSINYVSDARKALNFSSNIRYGGYYNGKKLSINGNLNYRFQPYVNLSLNTTYDKIDLPDPFKDVDFVLFGPSLDLTFTNKLFITTFIQYNDQTDNINVNLRFQWRFAPVSDLFIVYTNNSYPENFQIKDKALVAKISYWFN